MVSELFRIGVRLAPEWCPDCSECCPECAGIAGSRSGVTLEKLPGFRLGSAVRMNRGNRETGTSMAQKRLTMRQIHEILRLKYQNQLSVREIARSCGLAASTVGDYVKRAEAAGLTWPLPESITEEELTKRAVWQRPGSSPSIPAAAGLALHPPGTPSQKRDPPIALGRIPADPSTGGLQL